MQKMKIGIFGSSYSFHNYEWKNLSWISLLEDNFDITNHSLPGSSTYYSYKEFLKYNNEYDLIIFTITHPFSIHTSLGPINDSEAVNFIRSRTKLSYTEKKILSSIKHYMSGALLDAEIESQHIVFHNLMLEDIKRLRKEIIFIPSHNFFGDNVNRSQLMDITLKENEIWGISNENWGQQRDFRQCHMSEPNHRWLYQQVKSLIDKKMYPSLLEFDLTETFDPDNKEKYFFDWGDD